MFVYRGTVKKKLSGSTYTVFCPALSAENLTCSTLSLTDAQVDYVEGTVVAVTEFGNDEWLVLGELAHQGETDLRRRLRELEEFKMSARSQIASLEEKLNILSSRWTT